MVACRYRDGHIYLLIAFRCCRSGVCCSAATYLSRALFRFLPAFHLSPWLNIALFQLSQLTHPNVLSLSSPHRIASHRTSHNVQHHITSHHITSVGIGKLGNIGETQEPREPREPELQSLRFAACLSPGQGKCN